MQLTDGARVTGQLEQFADWPFPFLPGYRTFLEQSGITYLLAKDEDIFMPVSLQTNRGFRSLRCLFAPVSDGRRLTPEREADFLNALVQHLRTTGGVHRIHHSPTFALFASAPAGSISAPFGSYVVDLSSRDETQVFAGMKKNYRQVIRKAAREGVVVHTGRDQLEPYVHLHQATMRRSNMYCEPFEHFASLMKHLTPDHCYCSVAYHEGQPDGGIFILYTRYGAHVLYAGTPDQVSHPGSMKLLHWTAMQQMIGAGVPFYDFVGARLSDVSGSALEGIQRFKRGFGAGLKEGLLWKYDLSRVRCTLADTYLRLRNGQPMRDIVDQERAKAGARDTGDA